MKNLILLFMLAPTIIFGQGKITERDNISDEPSEKLDVSRNELKQLPNESFIDLLREYRRECDSIVTYNITEEGTIRFKVKVTGSGDFKVVPVDTTWYERDCEEYIENDYRLGNLLIGTTTEYTYSGIQVNGSGTYIPYNSTKFINVEIKRQKQCKSKFKYPTYNDFFEWVNKKYIEDE